MEKRIGKMCLHQYNQKNKKQLKVLSPTPTPTPTNSLSIIISIHQVLVFNLCYIFV